MEHGRSTWRTAIRLAITWSVLAAATAVVLATFGGVSQPAIVLSVIVVGFGLSWVRTGHVSQRPIGSHRVVRVPVQRTHPVG